jgi:hypothetical protein
MTRRIAWYVVLFEYPKKMEERFFVVRAFVLISGFDELKLSETIV